MALKVGLYKGVETWFYDFTYHGKRYRGWLLPVSKMTRKEATEKIKEIKAQVALGLYQKQTVKREASFKEVLTMFLEYLKTHKVSTYHTCKHQFAKLIEFFNNKKITPQLIYKWQQLRLAQGVSGATINRELNFVKSAYNKAIKQGLVKENPFQHFLKFEEYPRMRYLSKDELNRLLKATDGYLKEIIITAILTGMRKREILDLHVNEINFELMIITKKAENTKNNDYKIIPINDTLAGIFKKRLEKSPFGYVFYNPKTGKPFTDIKKGFTNALKRAGIADFRFHDLRHTFGTYALLMTKDLRTVQELLGHKDIKMTQRYTHILNQQKKNIIDSINSIFNL
ncbi:hypothetical protein FHQ18_00415 [Deferribacter autotrophicus]|uniref:Site-specific integrase n=1 Tax=Deferribacter autotrophicus TaxID=500465 RepID=A0A5A8F5F7_9BACT|nr:tyrosine-type recombinase/integrase [Deferribacter autotrophicus]KAA0259374.1 hypothetical protein FHQ18_00415 [Deferribacter autotrophicus]